MATISPTRLIIIVNLVLLALIGGIAWLVNEQLSQFAVNQYRTEAQRLYEDYDGNCPKLKRDTDLSGNTAKVVLPRSRANVSPFDGQSDEFKLRQINGVGVFGAWIEAEGCEPYFVGELTEPHLAPVRNALFAILAAGVIAALVNWVVGHSAHRALLREVFALRTECRAIGDSGGERRIGRAFGARELGDIAADINAMVTQIEGLLRRLQTLSVTLAHDLRGHINFARIKVTGVQRASTGAAASDLSSAVTTLGMIDNIAKEVSRLSSTKDRQAQAKPLDLSQAILPAIEMFRESFDDEGLALEVDLEPVLASIDEIHIIEITTNLLGNALKYGSDGGEVTVRTRRVGDTAVLSVEDFGKGVPESLKDAVFSLRCQADSTNEGSGFGLAIARLFASINQGQLSVEATREHANLPGARFVLTLPAVSA